MKKIHSRVKRRFGLNTKHSHYGFFHPGIKKHRPKTFKTEESANAWAANHGLGPNQYYLKKVKRDKKFQVAIYDNKGKNINDKKSRL